MYTHMVFGASRESHRILKKTSLLDYGVAIAAVFMVWVCRLLVEPLLGGASPLLPFTLSVAIAAYMGGFWPGMFAAFVGAAAGGSFFGGPAIYSRQLLSLAMFMAVSFGISFVFERLRRAHVQATENEEKFRLLVEGASLTSIFALEPNGTVESWNAGAERLTGYRAADIVGQSADQLYRKEDRERGLPSSLTETARQQGSVRWEGWIVRKGGEVFWAEVAITALRDRNGSLRGFSQVTRDLTESKRSEMAIAESEEAMRGLMESAAQGIVGVDRYGRIVLVNAMAEQMFGYTREELTGSLIETLIPSEFSLQHEGHRQNYFANPRNRPMGLGLPLRAKRKDGSEFPAEISLSSVQTRKGPMAVSFITDVTGRRAAELEREKLANEIADERARLQAVLEQMPVGVIIAQLPGPRIILHNREAEKILRHDVKGPSLENPYGAEHEDGRRYVQSEYPLLRALLQGEAVQQEQMRYRRGDNTITVLSVSAAPIRDARGGIVASVTTFTDIAPLKRAETERENMLQEMSNLNHFLERSNEDLRQFAYAASHDLQEPLRMVTSYTQLLERRYGKSFDSEGRLFIDYAVTGAHRIENLLKGLREYWQVSELSGTVSDWTDSNRVLDRALQNLEGAIREAGAVVTRGPLPVVQAAETPLLQLLQNLIGNSVKYRHPERRPAAHVQATAEGDEWVFSIRDNGIGIDPQYARQIFGIFKRLNGYRYSGAGIGLSICQKIVERFGGRIWVESEVGMGATFYFTLPGGRSAPDSDQSITIPAPAAGSHR